MVPFTRITADPAVMGGKPCVRNTRVTVGLVLAQFAAGKSQAEILAAYPYLEAEDLRECLAFAAWRVQEADAPFSKAS